MRVRFLPPLPAGWRARVGRLGSLWTAVREDGGMVAAAPTRRALGKVVARLGGRLEPGRCPLPREVRAHGSAFARRVWQACRRIPPGETSTYGQLAAALGTKGVRAVGSALGKNPLARLIPCHRVVGSAGLGGFAWGARRKAGWLRKEAD